MKNYIYLGSGRLFQLGICEKLRKKYFVKNENRRLIRKFELTGGQQVRRLWRGSGFSFQLGKVLKKIKIMVEFDTWNEILTSKPRNLLWKNNGFPIIFNKWFNQFEQVVKSLKHAEFLSSLSSFVKVIELILRKTNLAHRLYRAHALLFQLDKALARKPIEFEKKTLCLILSD